MRYSLIQTCFMATLLLNVGAMPALASETAEDAKAAAVADVKARADISTELPKAGSVDLSAMDVVLHAGLENYAPFKNAGAEAEGTDDADGTAVVFHPSDIVDLNNKAITYINEHWAAEELPSYAAYLFYARNDGVEKRLDMDDEAHQAVLDAISAKGYDADVVDKSKLIELRDFYLEQRSDRMSKKKDVTTALFENMDIVGFIKFDQEGRVCDMDTPEKNDECASVRKELMAILDKDSFADHCRSRALTFISSNLTTDEAEYAAAYHSVIDHKSVKFIVDKRDYNRDELREYMDGALMQLYNKGYSPNDTDKMKVAQKIRPEVIKICVGLVGAHKDTDKE